MKRVLVLSFLLLPLLGCAAKGIAPADRVILEAECGRYPFDGVWWVSEAEAERALGETVRFIGDPQGYGQVEYGAGDAALALVQIERIRAHFVEYRVQFLGILRDGKLRVLCNFFPREGDFPYWRQGLVMVFDGGHSFWQVECEPVTGRVLTFRSNGEA